ncbi:uncharacterized protein PGRI_045930 [Penicillium griseofulvum]|uniref:VOC domain-containing protein n=1 Tax=Penicillium patulum TaxID=5078 RepID=A0A135L9R9_PENPA|nr:uncharacterized protein PGRI_045930 [Penicillium griseofulvum]KXG45737.1 hypothetical protein PGRI_045930 [Penicillium griseofulvum]
MPVSHITLTVSHLPTSTSFFLSCLQPLGYQFIGRHDDYIGFGQKQGEPADFWMTETKPGSPPGAVHVAFPAPSKDAVGSFFISALKAGAKIHGEPKMRDSQSGYFSAAVIDFDGNSIEAVYRPSNASVISEASGPTIALLEGGSSRSVVSKASSRASTAKAESIAPPRSEAMSDTRSVARSEAHSEARSRAISKAPTTYERSAPTVVSRGPPPPSYTMQAPAPPKTDDGSKAAKTIVGTLIGAAAGAAIAYAMVKGESQSTEEAEQPTQFVSSFPQIKAAAQSFFGDDQQSQLRAIEAPQPPRSTYTTASNPRSTLTRSVTSKNPRASTIYDGTEYMHDNPRRASEGSIYSIPEDTQLRAIEYPPASSASQQRYACAPSTFISSYHDERSRGGPSGSVHSSSTIKAPSTRRHSHDDRDGYESVVSQRSHKSQQSTHSHRAESVRSSSHAGVSKGKDSASVVSSRSARNIPLPAGSNATYYSSPSIHSKDARDGNAYLSARDIPLPESVADLDVDSHVSPDDSISQVGSRAHRHRSHRSGHSRDHVRSSDSGSQASRASQRTVKAEGSRVGSRRGSQVV